ncbi:MAG: GNAT family N-acetyltransferase [Gallionella sp.]|nr:GNAT family N-acetyltransferase [Gallionella sp.]
METFDRCRDACKADASEITRLVNQAYRPKNRLAGWTHESDLVNGSRTNTGQIISILSRADSTIIIGLRSNLIIACIHLEKIGRDIHFGLFAVDPEYQGIGIGKEMLKLAENYVVERFGPKKIVMTVLSARHELINFYLRCGYRRTGNITDYPTDAGIGTPKICEIKIETIEKQLGIATPQ